MAELSRDGADAVITLSPFEKVEGLLGSTRFPLSDVTSVEVLDDALGRVQGMWGDFKLAGSYLPGSTAVGTFVNGEGPGVVLAVVHHNTPRGLELELSQGAYRRIVLGLHDPEAVKAAVFADCTDESVSRPDCPSVS
jgi:hypothetical protein